MKSPYWLLDFAANTYSQAGEDGIIRKALEMLPERNRMCVEFGAWDGKHLSNVRRLIEDENYGAVLIEGDRKKFKELAANFAGNEKIKPLNCFVGFGPQDNLDTLLTPLGVPHNFDFLSIDIDGNDYHVWKAMAQYRPKLVCIEFNPTIPSEVHFVQNADGSINQGCSVRAVCELAREKGYELVCLQPFNAFFVDAKYFPRFGISDNRLETMRRDTSLVTHLFVGYDGSVHLAGAKQLPWHALKLHEAQMQVLPGYLRRYPGTYSKIKKNLFAGFQKLARWRRGA